MLNFPMNILPISTSNNASMSQMVALSDRLKATSAKLRELNLQASRRLMEETQADFQKAMQVRTFAEAQSFFSQQTASSIQKVTGYWQNVGNIALETWETARPRTGTVDAATMPVESSSAVNDTTIETPTVTTPLHETEVQPSPLIEKLVASVVADTGKPTNRPKH